MTRTQFVPQIQRVCLPISHLSRSSQKKVEFNGGKNNNYKNRNDKKAVTRSFTIGSDYKLTVQTAKRRKEIRNNTNILPCK